MPMIAMPQQLEQCEPGTTTSHRRLRETGRRRMRGTRRHWRRLAAMLSPLPPILAAKDLSFCDRLCGPMQTWAWRLLPWWSDRLFRILDLDLQPAVFLAHREGSLERLAVDRLDSAGQLVLPAVPGAGHAGLADIGLG